MTIKLLLMAVMYCTLVLGPRVVAAVSGPRDNS